MNTCGTCKHKGEPITRLDAETYNDIDTGYFRCGWMQHQHMYGYQPIEPQKAFVIDGSDYHAALCVDDDFGCNQWAAKP